MRKETKDQYSGMSTHVKVTNKISANQIQQYDTTL